MSNLDLYSFFALLLASTSYVGIIVLASRVKHLQDTLLNKVDKMPNAHPFFVMDDVTVVNRNLGDAIILTVEKEQA